MIRKFSILVAALAAIVTTPALAHTGVGPVGGFAAGFGHPIGGLDHVLAMVAVGILAAQLGGRAIWTVPSAFVGMMLVGGAFGIAGLGVPFIEQGILGSVLILGAVIALGRQMPMVLAMVLVGVLAVFHGHAHGTEMPATASGLTYGLGFALATVFLHASGIALGIGVQKYAAKVAPLAVRISGGVIVLGGLGLAFV